MEVSHISVENPFFSICIPQYNRTSFLIEACRVLTSQTYKNFEVCISDDQSTDERDRELIDYLQHSGLSFIYKKQEKNQRYDGNIRASIALARGKYCLLHGNDDCLASSTILEELHQEIQKYDVVSVVVTNFEDWKTGQKTKRIRQGELIGSGVEVAATHFRNVAFVTGIIFDRVQAQSYSTDKWDGSEMYQMYIVARILASGGSLLELEMSSVRKDVQIPNESVDSCATRPKLNPCPVVERKPPFIQIGRLIADAIEPYLDNANKQRIVESIFLQLYLFTYPFWIIEYRRIQSWNYSLGICLGIRPKNIYEGIDIGILRELRLRFIFLMVCSIGLIMPIPFYDNLKPLLYLISKSIFSKKQVVNKEV